MRRRGRNFSAVVGLLWSASTAFAQSHSELRRVDPGIGDVNPQQISLRSFEVDLRQPLGFDLIYEGMRHDPYAGPFDRGERYLTRSSGAINAVFPRSSYVPTQSGFVPEIPAGTIFYIGDPVETLRGPSPGSQGPTAVSTPASAPSTRDSAQFDSTQAHGGAQAHDAPNKASGTQFRTNPIGLRRDLSVRAPRRHQSVQHRGDAAGLQKPPTRVETRLAESLTIWGNEAYRQRRVTHLLESAGKTEMVSELSTPSAPDASTQPEALPESRSGSATKPDEGG